MRSVRALVLSLQRFLQRHVSHDGWRGPQVTHSVACMGGDPYAIPVDHTTQNAMSLGEPLLGGQNVDPIVRPTAYALYSLRLSFDSGR